jgi:hypothetical protein
VSGLKVVFRKQEEIAPSTGMCVKLVLVENPEFTFTESVATKNLKVTQRKNKTISHLYNQLKYLVLFP